MRSHYRWKGEVMHDEESRLILHTTSERVDALEELVTALHPYDLPAWMSTRMQASESYAAWVEREVMEPV